MRRGNGLKIRAVFLWGLVVLVGGQNVLLAENPPPAGEIISRVIARMREASREDITTLNGFQGNFSFAVRLSPADYQTLRVPLANIWNREVDPELNGAGTFKVEFDDTSQNWKDGRLFLEASSTQFSFLLLRNKDEFTLFSPQLNLRVKDKLPRIGEILGNNLPGLPRIPRLPPLVPPGRKLAPLLLRAADKLSADSGQVARQLEVVKSAGDGSDCYRLTFAGENKETIQLDIRPDTFTPAGIKVISAQEDFTLQAAFPKPKTEKISPLHYLPVKISLSGKLRGNTASLELRNIRYNPFLSEADFRVKELNLTEFSGFLYLKSFAGE